MIEHLGGRKLVGPGAALAGQIEDHRFIEILPRRRTIFGKIGFLVRMLALPFRPETIDIAVMEPKDRVIRRAHIDHITADPAMDKIMERNLELDAKATPLCCVVRVAEAVLPRSRVVWDCRQRGIDGSGSR